MYDNGEGKPRNAARAIELYDAACKGGVAAGCSNPGVLYETGDGVVADRARAAQLLKKGCDGGAGNGCAGLKRLEARPATPR